MGSVTKSWTAAAIMKYWEHGMIELDAPITRYVDPILHRLNGTSMYDLWGKDETIGRVTVRMLMSMRGGIHDYNDSFLRNWTFTHPDQDWSVFDMLHRLNKTWLCEPGTCGSYSDVNYDILGLALLNVTDTLNWTQFDQKGFLNEAQRRKYSDVSFPEKGRCSQDNRIVHQYSLLSLAGAQPALNVSFVDIVGKSCLNGWTCGNIATTVGTAANWWWDLLHDRSIVSNKSVSEMMKGEPLSKGWSPGLWYGLGIMRHNVPKDKDNLTWTIGHGGQDWGSNALMAGYNQRFNVSLTIATNSVSGMNCSAAYRDVYRIRPGAMYSDSFYDDATCAIYDEIIQTLTNGTESRLNCSHERHGFRLKPRQAPAGILPTSDYKCSWVADSQDDAAIAKAISREPTLTVI